MDEQNINAGRLRAACWRPCAGTLPASSVVVVGAHGLVSAVPVTVAACEGTTSTPTGVINTPSTTIELNDTSVAGVGQVSDLASGKTVFLYDNKGKMVVQPDGTYLGAQGGIPLCGVHLDPTSGAQISEWSFCTDEDLYGCADKPPSPVEVNPKLTSDEETIIAYMLFHGDTSTAILQVQVWCISEQVPAGTVNTYSGSYFASQFTVTGSDAESAPLTASEETCHDQAYRDAAIAAIPATEAPTTTTTTTTALAPSTTDASQSGPTSTGAPSLAPTTNVESRGLPVTGTDSDIQLWFTALVIAVGGILVQLARRRGNPTHQ